MPPTSPASRPTRSASSSSPASPTPPRRVTPRPTSPSSTRSPPSPPSCLLPTSPLVSLRSRRARSPLPSRVVPTPSCAVPEATPDTRVLARSVLATRPRPRLPRNKLCQQKGNWCFKGFLLFASLIGKCVAKVRAFSRL